MSRLPGTWTAVEVPPVNCGEYLARIEWRFAGAEYVDHALVQMNERLAMVGGPDQMDGSQ